MRFVKSAVALAAAGLASLASAQSDGVLREAVRQAIGTNPEVTARLNAYLAGSDAVAVAGAALRPRVAIEGRLARTDDRITTRSPQNEQLDQTGLALTLNQLLWDGRATARDVTRSERERAVRWHELADATEQTTLEVARAYVDVQRYRALVSLAEENYVQHRYAEARLQARVTAGVSRGVDLEQAAARVALAEANLTTELANLHDVSARYQRLVGSPPPGALPTVSLPSGALPGSAGEALALALRDNAAITAAVENLRAVRASAQARRGAYHPRVEARVRSGLGRNYDGIPDQKRDTTAELVMSWNLYNGGADQARIQEGANLLNQAADLRDKTCRDVRQSTEIAFSDIRKLTELQAALERNTLSIEKARNAYRQQFDIGDRTLLDLLNAENEVYTARRALANAGFDLSLARMRTLAATQQLGATLGAVVPVPAPPAAEDASPADLPGRCPVEVVQLTPSSLQSLDARANELIKSAPPLITPPRKP
jgi:adhesin transport system outer membrane protein